MAFTGKSIHREAKLMEAPLFSCSVINFGQLNKDSQGIVQMADFKFWSNGQLSTTVIKPYLKRGGGGLKAFSLSFSDIPAEPVKGGLIWL